MALVTNPQPGAATAADIGDLERHEVIGGQIVEKASPSGARGRARFALAKGLGPPFDGLGGDDRPGGWWFETECELELERHEIYVPDVVGWRIERVPTPPRDKPVRILPDWVCEILSPSTSHRDLGHKQSRYHRVGIRHYWVVEPQNHLLSVFRWRGDGYLLALAAGPGDLVRAEPFETVELAISRLFGLP